MIKKTLYFILLIVSVHTLQAQNWKTDFEEAKSLAAKNHQNIVLVFQGSDWCAPCIKLDKEIWKSEAFIEFSKNHFVMLKADFPRRKANQLDPEQAKKNALLAEKYNPGGYFPFVVVLNKDGKVLGETGYKKIAPEAFIEKLQSFEKN